MTAEETIHKRFIGLAIEMAAENASTLNGGPFAAIVVRNGEIVGKGTNKVTSTNDPTAHAEVVAIRDACKNLTTFQLSDCDLYCSCEPCPMCLGAIFWARPARVFYAASNLDASAAGFDDTFIYKQIPIDPEKRTIPFLKIDHDNLNKPFAEWNLNKDKIDY